MGCNFSTTCPTEMTLVLFESIFPKDSKNGRGSSVSYQGETGDAKTWSRESPLNESSLNTRYV